MKPTIYRIRLDVGKTGDQVRIVVKKDMTVEPPNVGEDEIFSVRSLALNSTGSTLYIPDDVTLTMANGVMLLIGGNTELEIDGNLHTPHIWVGGALIVNGKLICTPGNTIYERALLFDAHATVGGTAASIANISIPAKSYDYSIAFKYDNDNDLFTDKTIYWTRAETENQLHEIIADSDVGAGTAINVRNSFDITAPVAPSSLTVEIDAKLTVKSELTVVDMLNMSGEISGAAGGTVAIKANAQINNMLASGGWANNENGTGVLHGLPVDTVNYDRAFIWDTAAENGAGAWALSGR
jgi:hypothetical protein